MLRLTLKIAKSKEVSLALQSPFLAFCPSRLIQEQGSFLEGGKCG